MMDSEIQTPLLHTSPRKSIWAKSYEYFTVTRIVISLISVFIFLFNYAIEAADSMMGYETGNFQDEVSHPDSSVRRQIGFWTLTCSITLLAWLARPAFYVANNLVARRNEVDQLMGNLLKPIGFILNWITAPFFILSGFGIGELVRRAIAHVFEASDAWQISMMLIAAYLVGQANNTVLKEILSTKISELWRCLIRQCGCQSGEKDQCDEIHNKCFFELREQQATEIVARMNITSERSINQTTYDYLKEELAEITFPLWRVSFSRTLLLAAGIISLLGNKFFFPLGESAATYLTNLVDWPGFMETFINYSVGWMPFLCNTFMQIPLIGDLINALFSKSVLDLSLKEFLQITLLSFPSIALAIINIYVIHDTDHNAYDEMAANALATLALGTSGAFLLFNKFSKKTPSNREILLSKIKQYRFFQAQNQDEERMTGERETASPGAQEYGLIT